MSKHYFFSRQPDILASSYLTKLQVNFWKKWSKLVKSSGISGVLTIFKLFFVLFSWSEKPKTFKKLEISSKSRFWNFFFTLRPFYLLRGTILETQYNHVPKLRSGQWGRKSMYSEPYKAKTTLLRRKIQFLTDFWSNLG